MRVRMQVCVCVSEKQDRGKRDAEKLKQWRVKLCHELSFVTLEIIFLTTEWVTQLRHALLVWKDVRFACFPYGIAYVPNIILGNDESE